MTTQLDSGIRRGTWRRVVLWSVAGVIFVLFIIVRVQLESVSLPPQVDLGKVPHSSTAPSPELTPRQVVWAQVQSLRDSVAEPDKVKICFEFASPENRQLTGPLERFSSMVATAPFDRLANSEKIELGATEFFNQRAAVPVLTIDQDGNQLVFQFVLRKQEQSPYLGCWMTEGVMPMLPQ